MKLLLIGLSAVLLERLLGEPRRWRPLAGFAWLMQQVENRCYGPAELRPGLRTVLGGLALVTLILPFALLVWLLTLIPYLGWVVALGIVYLSLSTTPFKRQLSAVTQALQQEDLEQARQALKPLVTHDTETLDEEAISQAAVELVLEQCSDGLFGVLFWFLLAGAPGAVVYRLVVVLDTQWGYPSPRYRDFGWATARLAGLLRWVPVQLVALSYSFAGDRETAWRCWHRQALSWPSPVTGTLLAAGAGALNVQLGGPVYYYQRLIPRPVLGDGVLPRHQDIERTLKLIDRALLIWVVTLALMGWLLI
ncbi:MAG: CobD/CbiB family cobalamin biosynthesis protein [Candidatus Competibacteraceae bacterium]|jgi:adenosylcobinamide-phosphate synthase|nr:CobD/CbiB family cobalamin biosynthesis protein [Candidatus Competibacteraceae bacterium]